VAATDPLPTGDRAPPAPVPLPVRTTHVYDHPLRLAEFQRLPALPSGREVELRYERVVEMGPVDNLQAAVLRALDRRLTAYVDARGGDAFGFLRTDMGFVVDPAGPVPMRFPDLAFLRAARLPDPYASGFLPGAPDLAVEIAGRHDYLPELRQKARAYLAAGAELVWVLVPPHPGQRVAAYSSPPDGYRGAALRRTGFRQVAELPRWLERPPGARPVPPGGGAEALRVFVRPPA
jgi:Uma2 family endonuclease